jgi:hypothetical protein
VQIVLITTNVFVKHINMKTLYYILFRELLDNTDYIAKAVADISACLPELSLVEYACLSKVNMLDWEKSLSI